MRSQMRFQRASRLCTWRLMHRPLLILVLSLCRPSSAIMQSTTPTHLIFLGVYFRRSQRHKVVLHFMSENVGTPNKSLQVTPDGAGISAFAVGVTSPASLSLDRYV